MHKSKLWTGTGVVLLDGSATLLSTKYAGQILTKGILSYQMLVGKRTVCCDPMKFSEAS